MGYIARTDGQTVFEMRVGVLDDIHESDRSNWTIVSEVGDLTADPISEVRYISDVTTDANGVYLVWSKVTLPAPYVRMRLKAYAADYRWRKTQAGVTLPDGNVIDTTETSKAKIDQALSVLERGWVPALNWKAKTGWITVDLAGMTAIAQAAMAYEQACFNAEQAVGDLIDDGTITSVAEVEAYAWP